MDQLRADREQSSTCSISSSTSTASTLHTTNAGAGNIPASSAPATTKVSQSQEQKNAAAGIHNVRWETRNDDSSSAVLSEPTREFDFNLLVAYSILAAAIAFIASLIVKF